MKRLPFIIVVLLLALSLACGGKTTPVAIIEKTAEATVEKDEPASGGDTEKTVEATKAAETEEPKDQPSSGGNNAFHVDSGAFEELDSYRSEMDISFTPDGGETGKIHVIQEATTDPVAQRIVMSMVGEFPGTETAIGGEELDVEVIMIGDKQWMRIGETWIQTSVDSSEAINMDGMAGLQETFIDPDNLNALSENDLKLIGEEKINGINTKHYSAEYDSLWGKLGINSEDIESGKADIWIAAESNLPQFVVRMKFEVKGKLDVGDTGEDVKGTMIMDMEVTDINQPISIEAPKDALSSGLPEDVPEYPGAEGLSAMGGMIMFSTTDSVEDVTAFYEKELEEAGWTAAEVSFLGPSWTKDNREFSLLVTEEEDTEKTSVVIMINEGE